MVHCRTVISVVVVPVTVCALSACTTQTHEHPDPTLTAVTAAAPDPSPTPSPGEAEAEAALKAFEAYQQMLTDTARMGGYDIVDDGEEARPRSVLATTMGEETGYVDGSNQRLKRDGERQVEGEAVTVSLELVESTKSSDVPGGHFVVLEACIDRRSVVYEGPEGRRPAPAEFILKEPRMYFDPNDPTGWKVAVMSSEAVDKC